MARMLTGLMLDARLHLLALAVAAVAWAASPPGPVESGFFAYRGAPGMELVAPPSRELVRHREVPGCPGCVHAEARCVATLPPT